MHSRDNRLNAMSSWLDDHSQEDTGQKDTFRDLADLDLCSVEVTMRERVRPPRFPLTASHRV